MYPLCPYHAAWKPASPLGITAGGGMPGPTLLAQVAARAGASCVSAATSATANTTFSRPPTNCLTRERRGWYVGAVSAQVVAALSLQAASRLRPHWTYDKGTAK